jgi:hypothetical protein
MDQIYQTGNLPGSTPAKGGAFGNAFFEIELK